MISLNNFLNRPYLQERVHQTLTIPQNQMLLIHPHDKPYLCLAAACWLKADSVVNVLHRFYYKHYFQYPTQTISVLKWSTERRSRQRIEFDARTWQWMLSKIEWLNLFRPRRLRLTRWSVPHCILPKIYSHGQEDKKGYRSLILNGCSET